MLGNHAVGLHLGIMILNQVIPCIPLPNDLSSALTRGFDLDEVIHPERFPAHPGGVAAGFQLLLFIL